MSLPFKFPASRTATLVATLASATLGDVLLARCSGSGLRVNLLPAYLVGELAAEGLARQRFVARCGLLRVCPCALS